MKLWGRRKLDKPLPASKVLNSLSAASLSRLRLGIDPLFLGTSVGQLEEGSVFRLDIGLGLDVVGGVQGASVLRRLRR